MAKTATYKIKSVLSGQSPSAYFGTEGQFLASIAIDPEETVNTTLVRPSGAIVPTRHEKFSSTGVDSSPNWIIPVPQNATTYAYLANGKFVSYSGSLGSETSIGTVTSGNGFGAAYYNDYIYLRASGDISRYGTISSGSPSLTNGVWTGATLGSQGGLSSSGSINFRGYGYPLGQFHEHYGKLYFLDFNGSVGKIHFIYTAPTGGTDLGSTSAALTLPSGFMPTCIESFGSDLAIVCITGSTYNAGTTIRMDNAVMFLWDTFSSKPYRKVSLSDPLATAIYTHNGVPFVWTGSTASGVRLSRYIGGNQMEQVTHIQDGFPPPAGAVDAVGNRLAWGGITTFPSTSGSVFSRGYFSPNLPAGAINNIAKISGTGTLPVVTCVKFLEQSSSKARPVMGWRTDTPSAYGLDKPSSSAVFSSVFYSEIMNVGKPFQLVKVRFPLGAQISTNMTFTSTVYVDDAGTSTDLDTVNPTNFPNSERNATIYCNVSGNHNFFIAISFAGTVSLPILLPIEVTVELLAD